MRKIVLALLVLFLAVPAMATVEVRCAQVSDTKQVVVTYDVDDGNDFRAFGINISVDNGATISDLDVNDADYWVFPGSIDINDAGEVNDVGTPIAAQDSSSFILEMGSLYKVGSDEDHNTVPPTSGQLCSFMVDGDCNVVIANDAARGGVVMEDIDKTFAPGYVTLVGCQLDWIPCFPESDPNFSTWVSLGEPECWCYASQCYGDAEGTIEGALKSGGFYKVGYADITVLSNEWKKKYQTISDPNAQNYNCADFDHLSEGALKSGGFYRVGYADITILSNNWKAKGKTLTDPNFTQVAEDCGGDLGEKYADYFP